MLAAATLPAATARITVARTGNGIAAREYMRGVRHKCVGSLDLAALERHDLRKRTGVDRLTDRNDNDVARRAQQRCIGVIRPRTAVRAIGADDLRRVQSAATCPFSSASIWSGACS